LRTPDDLGYEDGFTRYSLRLYTVNGAARDDVPVILYDDTNSQPLARQWFTLSELDPHPMPSVGDWIRDVVIAQQNPTAPDVCRDCGNIYAGLYQLRGHAPDCDYYDGDRA
jgi:hypothetical protein